MKKKIEKVEIEKEEIKNETMMPSSDGLYHFTAKGKFGEKHFILSEPSPETLMKAFKFLYPSDKTKEADALESGLVILRECWIDGDQMILNNGSYRIGAALACNSLIDIAEISQKKN